MIALLAAGLPTAVQPAACERLELVEASSGRVAWSAHLQHGEEVVLGFTHSLYRVEQKETFVAEPGGPLRLREVSFGSHEAAAYYDPDPVPTVRYDNGVLRLAASSERRIPPTPFRVGYRTGHFVETATDRIWVADHVAPGELALLRLRHGCPSAGLQHSAEGR